jgi:DNA-binding transcriptional regulator YiaG
VPTRAQLEKAAAKADRDHRKWLDRAELAEKTRAVCQSHAEALAAYRDDLLRRAGELPAPKALSSIREERSMLSSKMELQNERVNKRVKISATMTSESGAKRALLEAGITPRDVAALLGVGHSTVNAWCTGARSIPRAHVDRLREKHKIPAKVWPKIAG